MSYCMQLITATNEKYSSQYKGELATHLPMALVALERMEASPERLQAYSDHYVKRLVLRQTMTQVEITAQNWGSYVGQNKYHTEFLVYFKKCLEELGLELTLQKHLPILFRGVGGGAFHGLIRLGYAVETNNTEEIYQALGYWAVSYLELDMPAEMPMTQDKSPKEVFDELSLAFEGNKVSAPNIARRMELIGHMEGFQRICSQVRWTDLNCQTIASLVLALFAQTADFTAMHAVTANHAFRTVSSLYSVDGTSCRHFFVALAAAYVSIRAPKMIGELPSLPSITWQELMDRAVQSNDDHVPKIVYTCHEEFKVYRNPTYLIAASQYVAKIG